MSNGLNYSPYLDGLLEVTNEMNNFFAQYMFILEQFDLDSARKMVENPQGYIGTLYSNNMYSKSVNITHGEFKIESEKSLQFLFKSMIIRLYTSVDQYEEEICLLVKSLYPNDWTNAETSLGDDKHSDFDVLAVVLGKNNLNELIEFVVSLTRTYFRWYRNVLVHNDPKTIAQIDEMLKKFGSRVIKYWRNAFPDNTVDFKGNGDSDISPQELIGMLQVVRGMYQRIDKRIIAEVDRQLYINWIYERFHEDFEGQNFLRVVRKAQQEYKIKYQKLLGYAKSYYGVILTKQEAESLILK